MITHKKTTSILTLIIATISSNALDMSLIKYAGSFFIGCASATAAYYGLPESKYKKIYSIGIGMLACAGKEWLLPQTHKTPTVDYKNLEESLALCLWETKDAERRISTQLSSLRPALLDIQSVITFATERYKLHEYPLVCYRYKIVHEVNMMFHINARNEQILKKMINKYDENTNCSLEIKQLMAELNKKIEAVKTLIEESHKIYHSILTQLNASAEFQKQERTYYKYMHYLHKKDKSC